MFRRTLTFLILFSMMLHCCSRLGVLSYLYENRHEIAYNVGLAAEIPIALCGSSYDFSKELKIETSTDDQSFPRQLAQAVEINLFLPASRIEMGHNTGETTGTFSTFVQDRPYASPEASVFHPPAVA